MEVRLWVAVMPLMAAQMSAVKFVKLLKKGKISNTVGHKLNMSAEPLQPSLLGELILNYKTAQNGLQFSNVVCLHCMHAGRGYKTRFSVISFHKDSRCCMIK